MRERRAAGLDRSRPPPKNPRPPRSIRNEGRAITLRLHQPHATIMSSFVMSGRDGVMMYPERVTGDHWRPGAAAAEVKAAFARHDRRLAQ